MSREIFCFIVLLFFEICLVRQSSCELSESGFVEKLGGELWELSQIVTKYTEIMARYKNLNARVDTNDGRNLTGQIIANVNGFLKRTEHAVRCIQQGAETLAANAADSIEFSGDEDLLEYYSMKFFGKNDSEEVGWELSNYTYYPNMDLSPDEHFYNILVNITHSAVHVPTNLYDRYPSVAETILWTKQLDRVFLKNYENYPSLGWQYYGSSSGMMRQFPAMKWADIEKDLYDCRTRDWYIEAATCTKDVVILMDNSGSMKGMRNTIAKLVVNTLLDTLGNNDFVNVFNFSWRAKPLEKCNWDLFQATMENVDHLKSKVMAVKPDGNASVHNAFETAFETLQKARERRGCANTTNCHQAIMLITDGLPGNKTDIFERYNRLPDGGIPVRIFTYLVGLEVEGVKEMQDIACQNRGYYVHIHGLDEVRDQVLKYISVIARPMVLYGDQHPIRWTHLSVDAADPKVSFWLRLTETKATQSRLATHMKYIKSDYFSSTREDAIYLKSLEKDKVKYNEYKTMVSVSVPVYKSSSLVDNETQAILLGVAGSDVWVNEIFKLTYPYKIGANGYAFIVTNNGYLIMHPDLRPVENGTLKNNFASVDLIDVEFPVSDTVQAKIRQLRDDMVDYKEGSYKNIPVKFHYDNMRRVGVENRDYYFSPIPDTPYTLGLAIPSDYGNYQIGIGDEVLKVLLVGDNLERYFEGDEWRLHPDWFYCGYNNQSSGESHEETFKEIIRIINQLNWKNVKEQMKQAKTEPLPQENEVDCEASVLQDIFNKNISCDIDLLQLVVFDAKLTDPFKNSKLFKNDYEKRLLTIYNATLRFVSTQSGLIRWRNLPEENSQKTENTLAFGDLFPRAIDEPWFKAAVLQYNIDTRGEHNKDGNSFVFSVPFFENIQDINSTLLTATIAIFPRDGGRKAPASVLGYQVTYQSFKRRFQELSRNYPLNFNCHEDHACYVLDHNGYIVLDYQNDEIGKYFGDVEPYGLNELVQMSRYKIINIVDHQALCFQEEGAESSASLIRNSWVLVKDFTNWLIMDALLLIFNQLSLTSNAYAADSDDYFDGTFPIKNDSEKIETKNENNKKSKKKVEILKKTCTKTRCLLLREKWQDPYKREVNTYSRVLSSRSIPYTNLLLVVIDLLYIPPEDSETSSSCKTNSWQTVEESPCEKYERAKFLKRRSLSNCTTYHPDERTDVCGSGSTLIATTVLIPLGLFVTKCLSCFLS